MTHDDIVLFSNTLTEFAPSRVVRFSAAAPSSALQVRCCQAVRARVVAFHCDTPSVRQRARALNCCKSTDAASVSFAALQVDRMPAAAATVASESSYPDYYEVRARRRTVPLHATARASRNAHLATRPSCPFVQVLGIPRGATDAEIKRSYRKVRRCDHPERIRTPPPFIVVWSPSGRPSSARARRDCLNVVGVARGDGRARIGSYETQLQPPLPSSESSAIVCLAAREAARPPNDDARLLLVEDPPDVGSRAANNPRGHRSIATHHRRARRPPPPPPARLPAARPVGQRAV